ncbi:hypothetical protein [Chitinophaga sp.]|uniref:hypothetical protein n=1 Tax=Chitinophaga sp. TaxID=1869181 RepID=UPI0031DFEC89
MSRKALENLVHAVDKALIKPLINPRYLIADLSSALEHIVKGAFGKIVIEIN